ncbi:MAG: trk system potassium uptake protein TrkH [Myxococcota bacterium]|jgi:trk system potassium uptake protein TrkH
MVVCALTATTASLPELASLPVVLAVVALGLLTAFGDVAAVRGSVLGRMAVTGAIGALTAHAVWLRLLEPTFGLFALISATVAMGWMWGLFSPVTRTDRVERTAVAAMLPAWVLALTTLSAAKETSISSALPLGIIAVLLGLSLIRAQRDNPRSIPNLLDALLSKPATLLVVSFSVLGALGAAALLLPIATRSPEGISVLDAVFTAISAVCVTGLSTLNTPVVFSGFGQLVLLVLIQIGGLGIMTFATAAAVYFGQRLGVKQEKMAAELMGSSQARQDLKGALATVLGVTFLTELVGVLCLWPLFVQSGDSLGHGLWRAVFTSISAFCNAGFALQSNSLIPYQTQPLVLLVISAVIVIGSLGPMVVVGLPWLRRQGRLHARLVVVVTAVLLVVPAFLWMAVEGDASLDGLGTVDALTNSWFQAVTLRTAGFNSVDLAQTHPSTWTMMVVCMFVGGSPGSTAGGVKTTTVGVLLLAVLATIRGRSEAEAFGRRIPHRTIYEATAITTVAVLSACVALWALQLTQTIGLRSALFEVVSALATVGLTIGATGELDGVGKIIIIACMFAGRIGPLTLFLFLVSRIREGRRYPLEAIQVG